MRRLDLTGEWTVRRESSKKIYKAVIPGCLHADLLLAQEIPDPFIGRKLQDSAWVAEEAWTYENIFTSDDLSGFSRVMLSLEGVEGVATVSLNGQKLGKTEALAHRSEFDVKKHLKIGKNTLSLAFDPAVKRGKGQVPPLKPAPNLPTMGIAGDASILAFDGVRVTDVLIEQDFSTAPTFVGIDVTVCTERFDPDRHMEVLVRICYKGNTLHEVRDILKKDRQSLHLKLKNAQYWWPAGMGEQPLYEILIDVYAERVCLEHLSKRIGIRDIHVQKGKDGQVTLVANKQPVFVKGTRWVSPDLFPARLSRMEYARLVKATVVANMNLLRLHEMADFECNAFYDLCDEYGVMVWHDALDVDLETNIRRLRHHASLAVWGCEDAGVIKKLKVEDPGRAILPVELFLRKETFSVASFPDQRIVQTYLSEEERNLSHPTCVYHTEEDLALAGMVSSFAKHFLFPTHFESVLWLSQIQQGVLLKRDWEYVRCMLGDSKGFIHGRLNDFWPQCSHSTVDYEGRWKAAHYMLRKAMMPLWTTGLYSEETKQVELFAFNDLQRLFKGSLVWRLVRTQGELVAEGSKEVALSPSTRDSICALPLAEFLDKYGAADLFLWLELKDEKGSTAASNVVYFCEPREWALPHPRMRADIRIWDDNSFAVTLTSPYTVMWVWLSLEGMDARYDDNYFCLEPGKPIRIRVTPARRIKSEQFNQLIRIGSLRDTWQEKRTLMQMVVPQKKVADKK
jgi:beta-galactosidase/beta-glucuronidase